MNEDLKKVMEYTAAEAEYTRASIVETGYLGAVIIIAVGMYVYGLAAGNTVLVSGGIVFLGLAAIISIIVTGLTAKAEERVNELRKQHGILTAAQR